MLIEAFLDLEMIPSYENGSSIRALKRANFDNLKKKMQKWAYPKPLPLFSQHYQLHFSLWIGQSQKDDEYLEIRKIGGRLYHKVVCLREQ